MTPKTFQITDPMSWKLSKNLDHLRGPPGDIRGFLPLDETGRSTGLKSSDTVSSSLTHAKCSHGTCSNHRFGDQTWEELRSQDQPVKDQTSGYGPSQEPFINLQLIQEWNHRHDWPEHCSSRPDSQKELMSTTRLEIIDLRTPPRSATPITLDQTMQSDDDVLWSTPIRKRSVQESPGANNRPAKRQKNRSDDTRSEHAQLIASTKKLGLQTTVSHLKAKGIGDSIPSIPSTEPNGVAALRQVSRDADQALYDKAVKAAKKDWRHKRDDIFPCMVCFPSGPHDTVWAEFKEDSLWDHANQLHGPKPYPCMIPDCSEVFSLDGMREEHFQIVHEQPGFWRVPCVCPYPWCSEKFDSRMIRDSHFDGAHGRGLRNTSGTTKPEPGWGMPYEGLEGAASRVLHPALQYKSAMTGIWYRYMPRRSTLVIM